MILLNSIKEDYNLTMMDHDVRDDYIIDKIYESIDSEEHLSAIFEAAETMPLYNKYSVLLEAVDELNNIKIELTEISKEKDANIFKRIINGLRKLFNWWYKEDPNCKFRSLKVVLKILLPIIGLIITLYGMPATTNKLAGKLLNTKAQKVISKISYHGKGKHLSKMFSERANAMAIIRIIYSNILTFIKKTDHKIYSKVNENDINLNIKELDKTVDKLNEMIENADDLIKPDLIKSKNAAEESLKNLMQLKEEQDLKNKKNKNKKKDGDK